MDVVPVKSGVAHVSIGVVACVEVGEGVGVSGWGHGALGSVGVARVGKEGVDTEQS